MKRVYQIASLFFLAFSIYLVFASLQMEYYADLSPGAGFFPFWLGILMAVLSIIWLVQASTGSKETIEEGFIPHRRGVFRILSILVMMVFFAYFVDILGFQLAMLIFLGFMLIVLGRRNLIVTAVVALAGSFGVYYAFTRWLDVNLPASSIEFLQNLGL